MKTNLVNALFFSFVVFLSAVSFTLAQDTTKHKTSNHQQKMEMEGMNKDMKMDKNMEMGKSSMSKSDKPALYKGVINLKSIDINKDGKVYQCPMDFNVLSDKPGVDPKCGMTLKEVTLKQAKGNLVKAGFKVK